MRRLKTAGALAAILVGVIIMSIPRGGAIGAPVPRIEIKPHRAFIDEDVRIVLRGFPAGQPVIVRAWATNLFGHPWESHAEFLTDRRGRVDVAAQAPRSGTYHRADATGLFWSMSPSAGKPIPGISAPESLKPIDFEFTADVSSRTLAAADFERYLVAPGVERIPVRDGKLRGTFFVPSGKGPHPGVIVLGGSEGGLHELSAAFLASKGYAALALAYFSYEDLPKYLQNIPLEYFESGINWLRSRPEVRADQIAVLGDSRGGELALLLGSTFPQIKAVIAFAPSGVLWGGLGADENCPEQPAWIYHGHPLPFMGLHDLTPDQQKQIRKMLQATSFSSTQVFQMMLANWSAVEKASIPVARIHGPVLLISGNADELWPSTRLANMVMDELEQAKHPYPDRHLAYEGVGHFIPLPNFPTTVNTVVHPITKMKIDLGGDPGPTATAAADAWAQILDFLGKTFRAGTRNGVME